MPLKYSWGALQGLHYMHEQGIVHGDIKPDNVLLGGPGGAALSDLGCAQRCRDTMLKRPRHGTPAFMAPEMIAPHTRYECDACQPQNCQACAAVPMASNCSGGQRLPVFQYRLSHNCCYAQRAVVC